MAFIQKREEKREREPELAELRELSGSKRKERGQNKRDIDVLQDI